MLLSSKDIWSNLPKDFENRLRINSSESNYFSTYKDNWLGIYEKISELKKIETAYYQDIIKIDGFGEVAFYSLLHFFMEE